MRFPQRAGVVDSRRRKEQRDRGSADDKQRGMRALNRSDRFLRLAQSRFPRTSIWFVAERPR